MVDRMATTSSPEPKMKIRIEGLDFRFGDGPKARNVIEGFHLVVRDQEFISIVGASGSVTSTSLTPLLPSAARMCVASIEQSPCRSV